MGDYSGKLMEMNMKKEITGVMVYYYFVCHRKLWYFYHNVQMEQENEDVLLGKLIDENTYKNDKKHININDVINIDFIRSKDILHEVKKSNKIEDASVWQVKYYLFYLKERGVEKTASIDYPLLKQTIKIELNEEDEIYLHKILADIKEIVNRKICPEIKSKKICKKCAYYDLCFI